MGRDANPGGPGGTRRSIPHNVPGGKTSHRAGGDKKGCGKTATVLLLFIVGLPIAGIVEVIRVFA